MYGDIPILVGEITNSVGEIISSDFRSKTEKIYLNTTYFSFTSFPQVKPLFIWAIDTRVVETFEEKNQVA